MSDLRDRIARALAEWHGGPDAEPWVYDMYTEAADAVLAVLDLDKVRAEAQVEALREYAKNRYEAHLTYPEKPVEEQPGRLARQYRLAADSLYREADRIAREAGIETGESNG